MTIMPTPLYMAYLPNAFSYTTTDTTASYAWAYQVASEFGASVMRYSIYDEPNWPDFLLNTNLGVYQQMYLAGYAGVKAANPDAQVLVGELSPMTDMVSWMSALAALPNDGIAIHPYYGLTQYTNGYVADFPSTPIYETEYGNSAGDPNPAAEARPRSSSTSLNVILRRTPPPTGTPDSSPTVRPQTPAERYTHTDRGRWYRRRAALCR